MTICQLGKATMAENPVVESLVEPLLELENNENSSRFVDVNIDDTANIIQFYKRIKILKKQLKVTFAYFTNGSQQGMNFNRVVK